jgi:hypothetical protein
LAIRRIVDSFPIRHSHTRMTIQPWRRRVLATFLSRRQFSAILASQNVWLLLGARRHRGQPCQKHPSTKSATRILGQQKSGVPRIGYCRRHPISPRWRSKRASLTSVERLPLDRTAAIILERVALSYLSTTPLSYRLGALETNR